MGNDTHCVDYICSDNFPFLLEANFYRLLREMEEVKPPMRGEILFREENILYVNFDSQRL